MNQFIDWTTLGTYGGALVMVGVLTQLTKGLSFVAKIPTQLWSYILALVVLVLAQTFTIGLTFDIFAQSLLNAAIISIAANGGYSAIRRISTSKDDSAG